MRYLLFAIMSLIFLTGVCAAHPPKSVDVSVEGQQVKVLVTHPVGGSKTHYIYKIETFLNGKYMLWQELQEQQGDTISTVYLIPSLKDQDVLEVKATCNKFGDKTTKVIIGQPQGASKG